MKKHFFSKEVQRYAEKWGVSGNGINQLLEHTILKSEERLGRIAKVLGLSSDRAIAFYSNTNYNTLVDCMTIIGESAEILTKRGNTIVQGKKTIKWISYTEKNKEKIVGMILYEDKIQSVMSMSERYFQSLLK